MVAMRSSAARESSVARVAVLSASLLPLDATSSEKSWVGLNEGALRPPRVHRRVRGMMPSLALAGRVARRPGWTDGAALLFCCWVPVVLTVWGLINTARTHAF